MLHGRPDYNGRIIDKAGLIPPDEPVIFIRGRDPAAVAAARAYCEEIARLSGPALVVARMSDQLNAIEAYQRTHGTRMPD